MNDFNFVLNDLRASIILKALEECKRAGRFQGKEEYQARLLYCLIRRNNEKAQNLPLTSVGTMCREWQSNQAAEPYLWDGSPY